MTNDPLIFGEFESERSPMKCCEFCEFWVEDSSVATTDIPGRCHRRAPLPMHGCGEDDDDLTAYWPFTDATNWCGEHQLKAGIMA